MATLGDMVVKIVGDNSQLDSSIDKSKAKLKSFADGMAKIGKGLSTFVTLPLLAAAAASVKLAVDAEETAAKFNTAFRDVRDVAHKTAADLAKNYGLSTSESQRLLAATGDLLKGFGASGQEALTLSDRVQKLSVDLSSYNNLQGGASRASEILTKAMLGERDALVSLGVKVSDADIQHALLERGMEDLEGKARLLAIAQVTLELVTQQSADAMGDFARTSDSTANQMRTLRSRISDVAVSFGQSMLPIVNKVLGGVLRLVEGFAALSEGQRKTIIVIGAIVAAIGPLLLISAKLVTAFTILRPAILAVNAALISNPIILVVAGIVALTAAVAIFTAKAREANTVQAVFAEELKKGADEAERQRKALDDMSSAQVRFLKAGGTILELTTLQNRATKSGIDPTVALEEAILKLTAANEGLAQAEQDAADKAKVQQETAKAAEDIVSLYGDLLAVEKKSVSEGVGSYADGQQARLDSAKKTGELIAELHGDMTQQELDNIGIVDADKAAAAAKEIERQRKLATDIITLTANMASRIGSIVSQLFTNRNATVDNYYATEKARIEASLKTEAEKAAAIDELDAETAKKRRQIVHDQAIANKAFAIFDVAIKTAQAIMGFLVNPSGPVGVALAIAAGVTGAVQAALVAAQPIPALARGGIVSPSRGGSTVQVAEGGMAEAVIPLDRLDEMLSRGPGGAGGGGDAPFQISVNLDGRPILEHIARATRNRALLIDARAVY